jgi:hypothetical protein
VLNAFNRDSEHLAALERVKAWTRARFKLSEDATILVSEIACALPGCPPLHTVVVFWSEDTTRHQLKLFKPVVQVIPDDLPPAWMKRALVAIDGIGDECC